MSMAVYNVTEKDIDIAYKEKNKPKIEKETNFILSQLFVFMSIVFKNASNPLILTATTFNLMRSLLLQRKIGYFY